MYVRKNIHRAIEDRSEARTARLRGANERGLRSEQGLVAKRRAFCEAIADQSSGSVNPETSAW